MGGDPISTYAAKVKDIRYPYSRTKDPEGSRAVELQGRGKPQIGMKVDEQMFTDHQISMRSTASEFPEVTGSRVDIPQ
jgi:hypothetical protein